jgi:hypothetical protein
MGGKNFSANVFISLFQEIMDLMSGSPDFIIFSVPKAHGKTEKKKHRRQFAVRLLKLQMEERSIYGEMENKHDHFFILMSASKRCAV